ncbi:MAG TPA: hypothetical protein VG939_13945 [Caulobacteraceae bacterium]|nr:hypothetical protein [Caulobacteraceae bacterium]
MEPPLTVRTRRHLELLRLARPLQRYARRLHPDPNASFFLVHQALSAAFAEAPHLRDGQDLESVLREDMVRRVTGRPGAEAPDAGLEARACPPCP